MAVNNIPEIINNYNIYKDGSKLIGVSAETKLPDLESMTETISGCGILGEYDVPNPGHFSGLELEIPFRVLYGDFFSLIVANKNVTLTLRGSEQISDGNGTKNFVGVRVIVGGNCKKISQGSMNAGKPMDASVTIEVTYLKIEVDGSDKIELDKLNSVYKINGNDQVSQIMGLC